MKKITKYILCLALLMPIIGGVIMGKVYADETLEIAPYSFEERVVSQEDTCYQDGMNWKEDIRYITIRFNSTYSVSSTRKTTTNLGDFIANITRITTYYTYKTR